MRRTFTNYNARCMMFMYMPMLIEECIMEFESTFREYIVSENSTMHNPQGITPCKEIVRFLV